MENNNEKEKSQHKQASKKDRLKEVYCEEEEVSHRCHLIGGPVEWSSHFRDVSLLVNMQKEMITQSSKLSEVQTRLADGVEHLSQNLDSGFRMGQKVISLFGRIVLVFLSVIIVLALVIVWVAKLDVAFQGVDIKHQIVQSQSAAVNAKEAAMESKEEVLHLKEEVAETKKELKENKQAKGTLN